MAAPAQRDACSIQMMPVLCGSAFKNKGVQHAARRGRRLPAVAARHSADRRAHPRTGELAAYRAPDDGAVCRPGLQDHDRPVRRAAHLLPRLLGQRSRPATQVYNARTEQERADRPAPADARQQARGDQGGVRRRHRRRGRAARTHDRRHALRPQSTRSSSRRWSSRSRSSRGDRAQDQGRPGQARRGAAASSPRRTRPSGCTPTRRPARRSSPAWASCTWRSSSTG